MSENLSLVSMNRLYAVIFHVTRTTNLVVRIYFINDYVWPRYAHLYRKRMVICKRTQLRLCVHDD